ncbi:MAG TPA: DUF3798 domain-containing protein [Rectinemataceae bacterium]|nr:DUF3798 domain-containing protein [Rectinemataceae bacterium]
MNQFARKAALVLAIGLFLVIGTGFAAPAKFHIGVCTETVAQAEDDLRGAEQLIKEYGAVKDGGMIQNITYPDDFMSQQETVISNLVALADDPLMKAVVTCNALPGVSEAYRRIRAKRPDILLLAALPAEDPLVIQKAADLAIDADFVSRGYTIVWGAKQLGAKTFVHISFPRHMSYESLGRRRAIMEEACKDLGLKFAFETAPDPTSDVGVAGAQQFILEKVPQWIQKYGPNGEKVAFFCTNDAHTEPLIKQILASKNGIFVEPDSASPLMGFPGALGLDLTKEAGNFPAIMKKVEAAVVAKGGAGRLGTWAYSTGFSMTAGLGELAKRVIEGKAKVTNTKDIYDALGKYTPGAKWNGALYTDMNTGVKAKNDFLVYMDTYVFGKGYLGTPSLKIPEKYYTLGKK